MLPYSDKFLIEIMYVLGMIAIVAWLHFFLDRQPVYKQAVLRPLKNVAIFEAQKSPVA